MAKKNKFTILYDGVYPSYTARTDFRYFIDYMINSCDANYVFSANHALPCKEVQNNCLIIRDSVNQGEVTENRFAEIRQALFLTKCILKYKDDLHFAFAFYFSLLWIPLLFCRLFNIKIYVDFISVPIKRIFFGKLLRTISKVLSNGIVVINKKMLPKLFLISPARITFELPMGVSYKKINEILYDNERRNRLIKEYGITNNKILFVSLGTIHYTRRLEDVVDAFVNLKKIAPAVELLIIGGGPHYEKFKHYISLIESIILTGPLDYNDAISLMSCADVGITYYPINLYDVQQPLKTIEYIVAGLPVIAVSTYGNRRVVKEGVNGFLIKDSVKAIFDAMYKISENINIIENMKIKMSQDMNPEWDYDYIGTTYIKKIISHAIGINT